MDKKREYKGIDLMKFIAAILVISLHTNAFYEFNLIFGNIAKQGFSRLAVPFFFICSGYFLASSLENKDKESSRKVLRKTMLRLLWLYVGWCIVYFTYDMIEMIETFSDIGLASLMYIRNVIFFGSHGHLWYMPALMLGVILSYIACKKKMVKQFLLASMILYLIGLLGQAYSWMLDGNDFLSMFKNSYLAIFQTTRNGLFFGFPFVMLGVFINQEKDMSSTSRLLKRYLIAQSLFFVEICFLLFATKAFTYDMSIMLVPTSYYLFKTILTFNVPISSSTAKALREYSTGIYFSHGIFLIIFFALRKQYAITGYNTLAFVLITLSSIAFVYVMRKLKVPFLSDILS